MVNREWLLFATRSLLTHYSLLTTHWLKRRLHRAQDRQRRRPCADSLLRCDGDCKNTLLHRHARPGALENANNVQPLCDRAALVAFGYLLKRIGRIAHGIAHQG